MKCSLLTRILFVLAMMIGLLVGCDKERIVQSTEYVHDIQYVQSPPDTIFHTDTLKNLDSILIHVSDTIRIVDTIVHNNIIHDTVRVTVTVHDTVITIRDHYDTLVVTDTVVKPQYLPSQALAVEAMQYYTDPLVLDYINQQYGLGDGWIFYLASSQMNIVQSSTNVYDIYGYLEYYSADWMNYYPLEFYWRVSYRSGDPSNPANWQMTEPPAAVSGHQPGVRSTASARPQGQIK